MDIQPWVEKYRPKTIDQVAHQEEVVSALRKSIETGNLPHLLFYGPPGTGKTSAILAIAHQLYGPELFKDRVLELNASDERGINVVRNKIKSFAQNAVGNQKVPGYPCPPYKLVILDEADAMTGDAQSALRRTMELYSKVTRFCIICNYISRIMDPLASRCAKFRFKPLSKDAVIARLTHIADQENITYAPEGLDALTTVSGGDMRKAVSLMQSASRVYGSIDNTAVQEMAGQIDMSVLERLLQSCRSQSFESMQNVVTELVQEGYPAAQLLSQLYDLVIADSSLEDTQKAQCALALAQADRCLTDGADEFLQLLNVGAMILKIYGKQPVDYQV